MEKWLQNKDTLISQFKISDVYNADETRLFLFSQLLTEHTFALKGDNNLKIYIWTMQGLLYCLSF